VHFQHAVIIRFTHVNNPDGCALVKVMNILTWILELAGLFLGWD
jgi:hypothetical protein